MFYGFLVFFCGKYGTYNEQKSYKDGFTKTNLNEQMVNNFNSRELEQYPFNLKKITNNFKKLSFLQFECSVTPLLITEDRDLCVYIS